MSRWFGLVLLCLLPGVAQAAPVQWAGNGHYYDLVVCGGSPTAACSYSWTAARDEAVTLTYLGAQGHLATVTSQGENDFILANVVATYSNELLGPWLGAYQVPIDVVPDDAGWTWVTGEAWGFSAWNGGEPNGGTSENYLHYTHNGAAGLWWNDIPNSFYAVNAYVVEFESVPEPATLVLLSAGLALAARRQRRS